MRFTVLFAALALAGCTVASTRMLDNRTAAISGAGNGFTNMNQVTARVIREAALEGQKRGFDYFVVLDSQNRISTTYWSPPRQTSTTYSGVASCMGAFCNTNGTASSTTYGGGLYAIDKPHADIMVRFYSAGEVDPNTPGVWYIPSVLAANPAHK